MAFSQDQLERYSRHFVLSEIGVAGQKRLLAGRVLVIGAGALGSAAALYLAAAGVGRIGVADYDRVELSNLQRQLLHHTGRVGQRKVDSARQTLEALNPDVDVRLYPERMTPDNIAGVIADYDFVVDATDRFETKFLINDACVLGKKPYVHAGIVRFAGQVMTYVPGQGPCLRCLLEDVPPNTVTCAQAGVLGAATGVLGSIQALEAVKYLTGAGKLLTGRVLYFDGLTMETRVTRFPHPAPDCRVCGEHPTIHSLSDNRADYDPAGCSLAVPQTPDVPVGTAL